jgi:site-specific recombinase XerD
MVCDTRFDAARGAARSLELYLRWLQEVRRLKPSTVSRRLSVLATFYRTCVIDGVLEHSPAEYVRRPHVPPRSPTLGLSHLQFEAMLTAERDSANPNDFALVAMLGLLDCGSSRPPAPTSRHSASPGVTACSR